MQTILWLPTKYKFNHLWTKGIKVFTEMQRLPYSFGNKEKWRVLSLIQSRLAQGGWSCENRDCGEAMQPGFPVDTL